MKIAKAFIGIGLAFCVLLAGFSTWAQPSPPRGSGGSGGSATNVSGGSFSNVTLTGNSTIPFATNATWATNIVGTLNPLMFGAVMDGTTDDWQAWSNTFVAVNLLTNGARVDLLGRAMYISKSPAPIATDSVEVFHGRIYCASNIWAIGHVNQQHVDGLWIHDLQIYREGDTHPGTNSFGINLHPDGVTNAYWQNTLIGPNVDIYGFYRGIKLGIGTQTRIIGNQIFNCWSNAIYQEGGLQFNPDETEIAYNNLNQNDYGTADATRMQRATNVILIQYEQNNSGLYVHNNNMGGAKQIFKNGPTTSLVLQWDRNISEGHYSTSSNLTPFEVWNSFVSMNHNKIGINGSFGASNYVAAVGLYATNGQHLNFSKSHFLQDNMSYDVWSYAGMGGEVDGWSFPRVYGNCDVRTHAAFRDTGVVTDFNDYYYPAMMGWSGGTNQFYDIHTTLTFGQNVLVLGRVGSTASFGGGVTFNGTVSMLSDFFTKRISDQGGEASLLLNAQYSGLMDLRTGTGGAGVTRTTIGATGFTNHVPLFATNFIALPTNYVAADWTPVSGQIKIVRSNYLLYAVSPAGTNALW